MRMSPNIETAPRLLALLVVTSPFACALFVDVPDDLSTEFGKPDASLDADVVDADHGADVGNETSTPFCTTAPSTAFCDDFDHGPILQRWDTIDNGPGFTTTLDTKTATSAPNALLSRIEASASGSCMYARARKELLGSFTRSRLAFSIRAEGATGLQDEVVMQQSLGDDTGGCSISTILRWNGAIYEVVLMEQQQTGQQLETAFHDTDVRIAAEQWTRLDVLSDTKARNVTLTTPARATPLVIPLDYACPGTPGGMSFGAGMHCTNPETFTREVRIDDVIAEGS